MKIKSIAPTGTCQFAISRCPDRWLSKESANLYTKASGSNVNWAFCVKSVEVLSEKWSRAVENEALGLFIE